MDARNPGEGRYAHTEREQRWLLSELPVGRRDPIEIFDRYLVGTRLRLRRMQAGDHVVWKLGQKVRARESSPELVMLTNVYLSEQEYLAFAGLDASTLHKTRWQWDVGLHTFAVDAFHDELSSLAVAEVELSRNEERLGAPPGAQRDVTDDDRFSGGFLAALDEEAARTFVLANSPGTG